VHLHDVLGEIAPALQLHALHCGLCSVADGTRAPQPKGAAFTLSIKCAR
jgi:hypothetical protein